MTNQKSAALKIYLESEPLTLACPQIYVDFTVAITILTFSEIIKSPDP
jgi:hypothetical protein